MPGDSRAWRRSMPGRATRPLVYRTITPKGAEPMRALVLLSILTLALAGCGGGGGPRSELRIPLGAGGVGFLPLYMMREHGLIEAHAREAGLDELTVSWMEIGGPAIMNDALL